MRTLIALLVIIPPILLAQDPVDIIRKSETLMQGNSSRGRFRMMVETPEFSRSVEMEAWWAGKEKALIVITLPKREAGNKTLKIKNELWMYLRNTEMTIKVPPSMMLQSWNGSEFTNDDLVRESSLPDDYTMSIVGDDRITGAPCWKIELLPKPTAPVVWGRLLHWVRKQDYLPSRTEYYDEKGTLTRTMLYTEIRSLGNRFIPSKWELTNNIKPGRKTSFEYLEVEFDIPISDMVFSLRELEKGRAR